MARPRIPIGGHGEVWTSPSPVGWRARTQTRDRDGRLRIVSRQAKTKGAAKRALERALEDRADPSIAGVTPTMTLGQLGNFWLRHRETHGKVRSGEPLQPQSLAAYRTEVEVVTKALGGVRVCEVTVALLDSALGTIGKGEPYGHLEPHLDRHGDPKWRSTGQMRSVLKGMLDLAVRHGALEANPMASVARTARRRKKDVDHLTVEQAIHLRHLVRPEVQRVPGKRGPNRDLMEVIDFLLGTGCRDGEALGVRWRDLIDLGGDHPMAHVCGTLVEPRKGYVEKLFRQDLTKSGDDRTLLLPDHVAKMLQERRKASQWRSLDDPVFASRTGNWLNPSNIRTRLRNATLGAEEFRLPSDEGLSPHDLRRTVGTLIAHEVSLDAARDQLGHSDGSTTYQHYVGKRPISPDVRATLDVFFGGLPDAVPLIAHEA